jgi:hypothetical protein
LLVQSIRLFDPAVRGSLVTIADTGSIERR